jgi:hypothetical protein
MLDFGPWPLPHFCHISARATPLQRPYNPTLLVLSCCSKWFFGKALPLQTPCMTRAGSAWPFCGSNPSSSFSFRRSIFAQLFVPSCVTTIGRDA